MCGVASIEAAAIAAISSCALTPIRWATSTDVVIPEVADIEERDEIDRYIRYSLIRNSVDIRRVDLVKDLANGYC